MKDYKEKMVSVKELIKELLNYNLDAEEVTSTSETIQLGFIGETKEDTKIVFIDGCDYYEDD